MMPKKAAAPKKPAPPRTKPAFKNQSISIAVKQSATKKTLKKATAKLAVKKRNSLQEHLHYHKDGSLWARGEKLGGELHGYWEWYRKDGTRMRSGHFYHGVQCGEWTTYDKSGKVYKVTQMKPNQQRRFH
jgi:hypothetical protein